MTRRLVIPALVILTLLGGLRSMQVGHLSDDWVNVSHVSRHGSGSAFVNPWLGMGEESVLWHRPLLMVLCDVDFRLFGTNPFPAHLHHLLWHVLAVCLLYLTCRRLGCGQGAAFFGAILFAWHPYLGGTTGWLAARCGTVAGTFTLLTVFIWLGRCDPGLQGGRRRAVVALIAAIAAALTQESGYLALVAPLTIDLVLRRPRPGLASLVRTHAPFAVAGIGLLGLRYIALGTLKGGYPYAQGLLAGGEAMSTAARDLGDALLRLLGGAPPEFLLSGLILPVLCGVLSLVILIVGGLAWRRRSPVLGRAMLLLLALGATQILIFVLVSDAVLAPTTGQRWYLALALWSAVLSTAAASLLGTRLAPVPIVLALAFFAGHLQVQDHLVQADGRARKVLDGVMAELERDGAATGPLLVAGLPESSLGLPVFQWGFTEALRPPFRKKELTRPVYPILKFMSLGGRGKHPFHPPLEVLLHLEGKKPGLLNLESATSTALIPFDFTGPDGTPLARDQVSRWLETSFAPGRLQVSTTLAAGAQIPITDLSLPVVVETENLKTIEFFSFLPTLNMRKLYPVEASQLKVDLGPRLEDYARFRNEPVILYIIPVGYPKDPEGAPHLGPLLTFQLRP